ncbi:right-handed parallel beta-helix repeat-containing protein [Methanobrevibacter olleyae]|uniref:Adhesin-like protein n=1 Tax=Methanobrevibacter olleyae TaxID=294671 RepID=A0A126QWP7_METOL|nr:right-handed parallel beta-helix repeat-containing protein [Methanobrevibacter olleyae]AMK14583.1 adhesin-like protein [Methanobrevibacter olleyae]
MKDKSIILISFLLILVIFNIQAVIAEDIGEINIEKNQNYNELAVSNDANSDNQNNNIQENINEKSNIVLNSNNENYNNEKHNSENTLSLDNNRVLDENKELTDDTEIAKTEEKNLKSSNLDVNSLQSTIIIDGTAHNQMNNPTIQNAIDSAKAGDTIIITGKDYVHCHFIVNKKLTIISEVGTVMSPCPSNTSGSGAYGIFYISPEASGTVLKGFVLNNALENNDDYGIYIKGSSNVEIINCTINKTTLGDGIRIENAQNIKISDSLIKESNIGINLINSTKTTIKNNNIRNNNLYGVYIANNNQNTTIDTNNITYNKGFGISAISANYIYIINNFIAYNQKNGSGAGVYINCNITKIEIKGNFFKQNGQYGVLNDYRVRNMDAKAGAEKLEIVNNNYFLGHSERTIYHLDYKPFDGGEFSYNSENDSFIYVGEGNGNYTLDKSVVYLGYAFFEDEMICGATLYKAPNTAWSEGNYKLKISEISQVKKGTYQISIVDKNGNIAKDFSSIYVIFYLNKNNKASEPQYGDVYKKVLMKNGTATVSFSEKDYLKSGNQLLAVFPGLYEDYTVREKLYKTYNIPDSQIPEDIIATKISISNMNTYPQSGASFEAILKDNYGIPLAKKTIKLNLDGKTYIKTTDANGKVKLKIKLSSEKTYTITVSFDGDEEYNKTSAKAKIVVKKTSQKIISSNKAFAPNKSNYYSITLKDGNNKVIANKYVKFIINKKTYTVKTNSKGIAKIKIKLSKKKTYKITVKSSATKKYRAIRKTSKITIKSLKQKITCYNKRFAPNTVNYYSISLKDQNNIVIANKKITVKIGTKTYKKKTNKNGIVKIKIKLSKRKTYKVTIKSPKTTQYTAKAKTTKIVITSLKQRIRSSDKKYLPKAGAYYSISLKDENDKSIANKKVKFTLDSKTSTVKTNSKGIAKIKIDLTTDKVYTLKIYSPGTNKYKSATKTNKITIEKGIPKLISFDRTFSNNSRDEYSIYLRDYNGKALSNGKIIFTINGNTYNKITDSNGTAKLNINIKNPGTYKLVSKFLGDVKNKAISKTNSITIKEGSNISFIDKNLQNSEIQKIIASCPNGNTVEFLGKTYSNINLKINKEISLISNVGTTLNGLSKRPVLNINSNNVNISNFLIIANSINGESDGILINNSNNVNILNNSIINRLNPNKINDYNNGSTVLPGIGIKILNTKNVNINKNIVNSFESGIYNEYSKNLSIKENEIRLNNYGIKYGFGSSNTEIINNTIIDNIGWYTEEVPEGPRGYGLFLNNSAVNITIKENNISNNYMGISVDSNNSTGIVIRSNLIADNSLEGIRFNAAYDLAEDCVEPIVTDNAIYRNAEGPSMMILGEMSANPEGIYGPGQWNESLRLKIGPNWYGTNSLITWDYETGIVGVGTMCPRIKTSEIKFETLETENPGTYKINFYKDGELATNLASFDIYATLNRNTDMQTEVHFNIINGTGTFSFNKDNYNENNNTIEISVGSLINVVDRIYSVVYAYNVPESEIPT